MRELTETADTELDLIHVMKHFGMEFDFEKDVFV